MPRPLSLALLAATLAAVLPSTASAVTAPRTAARPYFDLRSSTAETRRIARDGRALTRPASGDRRAIAERYIRRHADAIGLRARDLATLELDRRVVSPGNVLYLRWRQSVRGIPLFQGGVRTSVAADGRVVSVGGAPVRGVASADTSPGLSSAEALQLARKDGRTSEDGHDSDDAGLVLYDTGRGVRLAWATTVYVSSQAVYHTLVDAHSGAILHRQNLVDNAAPALMWDRYPGASPGGAQRNVDLEAMGWLPSTATNLTGPFAHAFSDLDDNDVAAASGEEVPRASGFWIQFQDFTAINPAGGCNPTHQCSWNIDVVGSWRNNRSQATVQAFAYVSAFHDHLAAAPIGFDSASGNFEGADRVIVQTNDGADPSPDFNHRNNADMLTPPDVQPPRMQMYLFVNDNDFRDINGADDAAIVYHEYTHGLSNRLITYANGVGALDDWQPAAMGEGWSDFYAKDFLANQGLQNDTAAPGEVDMGEYTDSVAHALRTQGLDCPVGAAAPACPGSGAAGAGGYTYGDFGRIDPAGGAEEHFDGEIWGETLWDIRAALGSSVAEALVTGGMRSSPEVPTFIDARNSILDADLALFGGHHRAALWRVFSARGLGSDATTTGSGDTAPQEGFARPPDTAPSGFLSATPANVLTGAPVHFDAGGILDADGVIGEYRWDFDGNGTVDRTTPTPATDFAYAVAGSFPAAVTAVDDGGNAARIAATVGVTVPPPVRLARIFALFRITVDRRGRFVARIAFSPAVRSGKARLLVFRKNRRIGSVTVRVKKGSTVRVRVVLTKAGLRALKKSRRFSVSLRLQLPGSRKIVARKTIQLRAPKRR